LAEYAFALDHGGVVYTVTDVEDLHNWMVKHLEEHPLFDRIPESELVRMNVEAIFIPTKEGDPVVPCVLTSTDEAKKVEKAHGKKFLAVFKRK
jgi:tRNA (guanine-N7-)-methyltransferase